MYFHSLNKKFKAIVIVNKLYTAVIKVINYHSEHGEYQANEIDKQTIHSVVKLKAGTELHII